MGSNPTEGTNIYRNNLYYGCSTDDMNCTQTKRYLGSGRPYFDNAKKKYGRKNFIRKDLEFFPTKQEAFDAQAILIRRRVKTILD